jgi:hypothetical protein
MKIAYTDIIDRISDPPKWWDANGVPRYCDFHPRHAGIYIDVALLVLITCQACGRSFHVGITCARREGAEGLLKEAIEGTIGYGDPPRGCCAMGATMTPDVEKVIEAWSRLNSEREWRRVPEAEVLQRDHPAYGPVGQPKSSTSERKSEATRS